jgi:ABC-type amino acid transport substrate-binding protein
MFDIFTKILEQFGAFFQVQQQLSSLSNSNPVIAGALIFAITVFAANIVVSQLIEFRKRFFGEWIHSRLAWAGLAAGLCVAALISTGVVLNLRKDAAPIPAIVVDSETVIGVPLLLKWQYDSPDVSARFQVQSAKNAAFSEDLKEYGFRSGRSWLVGQVNNKRYWRIRAVDGDGRAISSWSRRTLITQYETSLRRIRDTHNVNVYTSDSFNEGFFKFAAEDSKGTKGYDVAVIEQVVRRLPAHLGIDGPINLILVPLKWDEMLNAPKTGRADIIISAITALPRREDDRSIKFSEPYYCTTQSLIYRPPGSFQSILRAIGNKRVGFPRTTTSEDIVKQFENEVKFKPVPFDSGDIMIESVARGDADYGLIDTPFARAAELQYGSSRLNFRELVNDEDFPKGMERERRVEKYGIAVRAGENELVDAINRIIDEMRPQILGELLDSAISEFYHTEKGPESAVIFDRNKDPSKCGPN